MISSRTFMVAGVVLGLPQAGEPQQPGKVSRVGVLTGSTHPSSPRADALRSGLRQFGYVDGQSITIEWRASDGRAERLPDLATELIRLDVDVIVAVDNPAIAAAQKATRTIPIVMVLATDPVGARFVSSLAKPGGNTTGLTAQVTELQGKALQLLKEAVPNISRVIVLWNPAESGRQATAREAEKAARALGLHAELAGATNRAELESFFATMGRQQPSAVLVQPSQTNFAHRSRIAELAKKRLAPTMGWSADTVEAGWLMSYGPSIVGLYQRAGYFVDKVLKGVRPADLPIEQPTTFELVINLKTARELGLSLSPSLLARADQVIQ